MTPSFIKPQPNTTKLRVHKGLGNHQK